MLFSCARDHQRWERRRKKNAGRPERKDDHQLHNSARKKTMKKRRSPVHFSPTCPAAIRHELMGLEYLLSRAQLLEIPLIN
jgi:hypothetical protein